DVPLNWQSKGTDELIILLPAIQAHVEFLEPPEEPKQELTHPEQERLLGTSSSGCSCEGCAERVLRTWFA
ncbi:unnamed protein product, partial [Durusdinium trenchii]